MTQPVLLALAGGLALGVLLGLLRPVVWVALVMAALAVALAVTVLGPPGADLAVSAATAYGLYAIPTILVGLVVGNYLRRRRAGTAGRR